MAERWEELRLSGDSLSSEPAFAKARVCQICGQLSEEVKLQRRLDNVTVTFSAEWVTCGHCREFTEKQLRETDMLEGGAERK